MAIKKVIEIEVQTDEAVKDVNNLTESVEDLGKEGKKASKGITDSSKNAKKGLGGISKGFKGIGLAIKAAGIGLVIGLFVALKDIVGKNQAIMDGFSSVMTTIGLVFNAVTSAVSDAFDSVNKLSGGFDAAKAVIGGLINIGLAPLKVAFFTLKAGVIALQLIWEKSFLGKGRPEKIQELKDALAEVNQDLKDVAEGVIKSGLAIVENFGEAVTEIAALGEAVITNVSKVSITALKAQADTIVALKNQAVIAQAINRGLIEDFDRQAELQRQIRDDVNKSIEERIEANNKLAKILEEQRVAMLKNADLVVQAARNELLLNNNIENQVVLTEALNEKKAILAQITGFQSEQLVNQTALINEQIALEQTRTDAQINRQKTQRDFEAESTQNEFLRLELEAQNLQIEKEIEQQRLQDVIDNTTAGTQARVDAEQALFDAKLDFSIKEQKLDEEKIQSKQKVLDAIIGLAGAESALGRAGVIAKQFLLAKELLIDLGFIQSKATRTIASANLDAAASGSSIATGFSKTLALGFPAAIPALIGYAAAAVGIVSSVASAVGGAKSVASQYGGTGAGATPAAPVIPATPQAAPSFNVVGTSGTNQIAQSISNQNQQPIQAFVVSTDITTQQELDRNKQETASFG